MVTELGDDSLFVPKEALCLMVVSHLSAFKVPIGYFLIHELGGVKGSNLVLQGLTKLHSVWVSIVSLTIDAAAPTVAMMKKLGCSLDPDNIKSYFIHPATGKPVRNSFGDLKKSFLMEKVI